MKYIYEFNNYKNSGRGSSLSEEEFMHLLKTKCSDWMVNPKPLVRFKETEGEKYELVNPRKYKRKSLNAENYNLMLMDNLPSWYKFPKRSKSIIFFNGIKFSIDFGDYAYFVIPFDDAKFGVAPSADLFTSYNNQTDFTMSFNDRFSRGLFNIYAPTNYKDFKKYMNEEFIKPDFMDNKYAYTEFLYLRDASIKSKFPTTMDYLNDILAPGNFESEYIKDGFKTMDYENMSVVRNDVMPVECWTDSNCLVVSIGEQQNRSSVSVAFKELLSQLNID